MDSKAYDSTMDQIVAALSNAQRVLFVTGAGLSADSGLPTYRGIGGLYQGMATPDGLAIETVLSGEMFRRRPELTWKHLLEMERSCRGASYNAAHRVIAQFETMFEHVVILTQNVDGLHQRAGSTRVIDAT